MKLMPWTAANHDIERFFSDLWTTPHNHLSPRGWLPKADVIEDPSAYYLSLEVPGLSETDVAVTLDRNVLTVSGNFKAHERDDQKTFHRLERLRGEFSRSFKLPTAVAPETIEAIFADGVLDIRIPKVDQAENIQIKVRSRN